MSVTDYAASGNTSVGGINIATGCSPANVDNALRKIVDDIGEGLANGYFATALPATKSAGYTVLTTDRGKLFNCTSALTLALPVAATAAAGFMFWVKANGAAVILDPNAAELIDGAATVTIASGSSAFVVCTGTAWITAFVTARERLTANRTYYVATTGSDSNTGLTVGSPFLTIQKAFDVVFNNLDVNNKTVTIQIADGTYTAGVLITYPHVGGGSIIVNGNSGTPANVIVSTTSSSCFWADGGARFQVQNLEMRTTTNGICVRASLANSQITLGAGVRFGTCAQYHIFANYSGYVLFSADYSIVGGVTTAHMYSNNAGMITCTSKTVTITGTPAVGTFALVDSASIAILFSNTYSGAATGTRYSATTNGVINTNGGGAAYLPGSVAGSTGTGGQYV